VLAITGTIYCFQPQIERMLYPDQLVVAPESAPRLGEDALLTSARAAMPTDAVPTTARVSSQSDRSAEFIFRLRDGHKESVYLNPYSGAVLGMLDVDRRFIQVDRMIHRKLLLGKPGELLMELVACWTLVMIGTGVALWWPREVTALRKAMVPDLTRRGRPLWKSIHATLGIWFAVGALAFVVTGLPWTGSWGKHFKALATSVKLGSPPGSWGKLKIHSNVPGQSATSSKAPGAHASSSDMDSMPGMTMDDMPLPQVPWAVGAVHVPNSPDAGTLGASPLPIGHIVVQMRAAGLTDGYDIALPTSPRGVYTVSYFPPNPKLERTVYIDQYSGAILKDIRYRDYGAVGKAVSYGTSLHMGTQPAFEMEGTARIWVIDEIADTEDIVDAQGNFIQFRWPEHESRVDGHIGSTSMAAKPIAARARKRVSGRNIVFSVNVGQNVACMPAKAMRGGDSVCVYGWLYVQVLSV
jgi:uncharacterized iron-regulated membrane protein